jgi:hypothetical protein
VAEVATSRQDFAEFRSHRDVEAGGRMSSSVNGAKSIDADLV